MTAILSEFSRLLDAEASAIGQRDATAIEQLARAKAQACAALAALDVATLAPEEQALLRDCALRNRANGALLNRRRAGLREALDYLGQPVVRTTAPQAPPRLERGPARLRLSI